MSADAYITRVVNGQEWEIPILTTVEEQYNGSGAIDDPSYVALNEIASIAETTGPFNQGDSILLTEDERRNLEEDELNYQRDIAENPY